MATPIAQLKQLHIAFLNWGCDFSKVPNSLKEPMLVKVFRTYPFFYISDKENYITGYFSDKAKARFEKSTDVKMEDLKARTLKINKFSMQMAKVGENEFNQVSYMDREIRVIIEDFTLSRDLSKNEVNKFVVNMWKDEEIKLHMAIAEHQSKIKKGAGTPLDLFLKTKAKLTTNPSYKCFKSTYMGPIEPTEDDAEEPETVEERLRYTELVTWIVTTPEEGQKVTKKRKQKSQIKQEDQEELEDELKEALSQESGADCVSTTTPKARKGKRSRKAVSPKQLEFKIETKESEDTPKIAKNKYDEEVLKILGFFKKSKSQPDMDFCSSSNIDEAKMIKTPKKVKKAIKISKFKEYMMWYDEKCLKGKQSSSSKSITTTLSTPVKTSLNLSRRIAQIC